MVVATVYALTAAFLHAGWNLAAKRSDDPFLALWAQFLVAGVGCGATLLVVGLPTGAWVWAIASGLLHAPYVLALAWAYRHGDFSLAYPVGRGGGALLAAIGGVALLDDRLSVLSAVAIAVVVLAMLSLAAGAPFAQVVAALIVAVAIGGYTVVDSHGARTYGGPRYVLATHVVTGLTATLSALAIGRGGDLWRRRRSLASPRTIGAAAMTVAAYGLVLLAVRRAPVGYVAALRESSVVVAVLAGWRLLGEERARRRLAAAAAIVAGLVLLVLGR